MKQLSSFVDILWPELVGLRTNLSISARGFILPDIDKETLLAQP